MKQNRPPKPVLIVHVLLIMVFTMGMFSSQPAVLAEAASIVPRSHIKDNISVSSADSVAADSALPYFVAVPQYDFVEGFNWTPDSTVKLIIDGTLAAKSTSNEFGHVSFGYGPQSINVGAGQLVKMTGGGITLNHSVANLKVKSIDPLTDTVSGKAAPGSEVVVGNSWMDWGVSNPTTVQVDAVGNWMVDLSGSWDFHPRDNIAVMQYDGNGNATYTEWEAPDPKIFVYYAEDLISGWGWWPGSKVTLTIGSYKDSITVESRGGFEIDLSGIIDIQPNDEISVSNDTIRKQLWVSNLTITSIDETADTMSGTADPDAHVEVLAFAGDSSSGYFKSAQANSAGIWTVDYSGVVELGSGTHGWVEQADGDGDCTDLNYIIPDAPVLTSLSKPFAVAGQPAMKLIANGSNFNRSSSFWWEENKIETTFISKNQLSMKMEPANQEDSGIFFLRVVNQPGGVASSPLPFQVIKTLPAYDGKLTSNYVSFEWTTIIGATGYKIQMSSKPDFSTLLINAQTTSAIYDEYMAALPRGKTYYWRIKPLYGDVKGSWSVPLPFNTQDPLEKPILYTPEPKQIISDDDTPLMDWQPVAFGETYLVQLSKLSDFSTIFHKVTLSETQYEMPMALPNGKYFWRVRAIDDVGNKGLWSEIRMFKIALP